MAKTKAELLKEAKKLKLEVTEKNTVAQITAALQQSNEQTLPTGRQGAVSSDKNEKAQDSKVKNKDSSEQKTAKAGKRSEKGLKEAEEKQEKVARQKGEVELEAAVKPAKKPVKPARSRLERRGKGYRKSAGQIDKNKTYSLSEGLELAVKTSHVKFDATVELHLRLNVDPKQADQNLRDSVVLPAGTGKTVKVATLTDDDDSVLAKIEKEQIDFDVLIATPSTMQKLAKYARVLGPKGLMPNPKSGTVTNDIKKAVEQAKAGKIEYRVDSTGNIHVSVGKVSFGAKKIEDNARAVLDSVKQNKPASIKAIFVENIALTTTMGPSIKVATSEL